MDRDYKDDNVWLMYGDCLERMKEIPDGSVDAIICDPPYQMTANKWDSVVPFEPMWAELKRVIKHNGVVALFGSQPFTTVLGASNIEQLKYTWHWRKSRPSGHMNAKKAPLKDLEDILIFYAKQPTYNPQGVIPCNVKKKNTPARVANGSTYGKVGNAPKVHEQRLTNYPRQVLDFASPHNVGAFHPTQKPVALMEYLIKTYTNEGETVLDFTAGSFTTGVACANLNRRFIGIEMDEKYFDIGVNRVKGAAITCEGE